MKNIFAFLMNFIQGQIIMKLLEVLIHIFTI